MGNVVIVSMIRTPEGRLEYLVKRDKDLVSENIKNLNVHQKIKVMFDFTKDDAIATQISRVHAIIGEIAKESGNEFDQVKKEVKKRAGLFQPGTEDLKSFTGCSSDDLSEAIKSAVLLAEWFGMTVK